jgi:hypothetical protein
MMSREIRYSRYAIQIAAAALIGGCWLQPVSAAQTTDSAADAEAAARENWRAIMAHNPDSEEGCFQASYPEVIWEKVDCKEAHPRVHPAFHKPTNRSDEVVGNGHDYVAESAGLINETLGTFPKVTGVKTEKGVGVLLFGDGGILGPNEYTLQINTNFTGTTAACSGHSGCAVWQQFVYATDYVAKGEAAVFMEYWLLSWGDSACPKGWENDGGDCVVNSELLVVPDMKITSLGSLTLSATATAGGNDTVVFNNGSTAYSLSEPDSVLDISEVWNESEFNIVGDAGGSRADFNKPVSITVKVALTDGSTSAPTCVANAGSTGETNNLNLGTCSATGGASPSIQFTESN